MHGYSLVLVAQPLLHALCPLHVQGGSRAQGWRGGCVQDTEANLHLTCACPRSCPRCTGAGAAPGRAQLCGELCAKAGASRRSCTPCRPFRNTSHCRLLRKALQARLCSAVRGTLVQALRSQRPATGTGSLLTGKKKPRRIWREKNQQP